ncbi:RNA-binding protein 7 [Pectinophora gossypiella]|uniref:RNA-binding protein 7 n=1 Tax=Pectinophora gossypiella TaxID=13191 RepID=UPI00214E7E9E|nr:RNA-binding protein 7 [Pectinophora gossypiella]
MIEEDNKTLWCGNLPEQATEEILYELFLQAGPLEKVRIARDRDGRQKNFAFITYCHEVSVPYAINLFRGTALFHKTLSLQSRGRMGLLPPPIRCTGPEPMLEFQPNIHQQFADMADKLQGEDLRPVHTPRGMENDKLVMASLQGNWSHRHHPYRGKDKMHHDFRPRDHHNEYKGRDNRNQSGWRDRRNHKKGNYHRRD